jgi:hypothetical protein
LGKIDHKLDSSRHFASSHSPTSHQIPLSLTPSSHAGESTVLPFSTSLRHEAHLPHELKIKTMRARVIEVAGQSSNPSQPLLLSILCICLLPQSLFLATTIYFLKWLKSVSFPRKRILQHATGTKRILVTGDSSSSILGMSRALRAAGHDVYVVDKERIPLINPLRSSNAITKFIGLPTGRLAPNMTAIKTRLFHLGSLVNFSVDISQKPLTNLLGTILQLIEKEHLELWIPCDANGLQTVLQSKEVVTTHSACQIYGPDAEATRISQDQDRFSQYVDRLGHDINFPGATVVRSRAEIHHQLSKALKGQRYLIERKASPLKTPSSYLPESVNPIASSAAYRRPKDIGDSFIARDYRLLPLGSLSETYSSVATLAISHEQPWLMHQVIEGRPIRVSALVVNNTICAFTASISAQYHTFSSAQKGKLGSGMAQTRNSTKYRGSYDTPQAIDSNSAISQALLDFTSAFVRQLPYKTNLQLNLGFIMVENATSSGVMSKIWATGCDFEISSVMIQQAHNFGQLESVGAAYSCALNSRPIVLSTVPATVDDFNSCITYSLPRAAYQNLWGPISNGLMFRASLRTVLTGLVMFLNQVAFEQEELFDRKDPLPSIWTWLVQFPVERSLDFGECLFMSLVRFSKKN